MAAELLMEVSQDERERAINRSRRMYETDRINDILTAEDRGRDQGRDEGRDQGRHERDVENINRMHQKGYDNATIADVLDITEEYINDVLTQKS